MPEPQHPSWMLAALEIARAAGDRILEVYGREFTVDEKEDRSPLTEADLAAHHCIVERLGGLTPDVPVLSEESASIPWETRRAWQRYWLVDPLDGTREFVKRNGEFTVNIALIENGIPTIGIVHVPVLQRSYYACSGHGAWRQEADTPAQGIRVSQLADGPVRVAGSRSHRGASLDAFLEKIGEHELVSMGSSLKLCLVAEGKADIYPRLGPTSEWDTAAAQCVVEQAGGSVTDTRMQRLAYNSKESLLNPFFLVFGKSNREWNNYLAAE